MNCEQQVGSLVHKLVVYAWKHQRHFQHPMPSMPLIKKAPHFAKPKLFSWCTARALPKPEVSLGFKQQQSQEEPATAFVPPCRQGVNPPFTAVCATSRDKCHCCAGGHAQGAAGKGLGMCQHRGCPRSCPVPLRGSVQPTLAVAPVSFSNSKTVWF